MNIVKLTSLLALFAYSFLLAADGCYEPNPSGQCNKNDTWIDQIKKCCPQQANSLSLMIAARVI